MKTKIDILSFISISLLLLVGSCKGGYNEAIGRSKNFVAVFINRYPNLLVLHFTS